jgi:hypothetical protein
MTRTAPAGLLPMLLAGCAMTQVGAVMHPTISGSVTVRSTDGTEVSWAPDRCTSGDLAYFVGFDFLSTHDDSHLRAVLEPIDGPVVRWTSTASGAQHTTVLRSVDCETLQLDVQPTAWRVNEVREFAGHVDLRCTMPGGARLQGRIDVDHCH